MRKKILYFSFLCLLFVMISYTYSSFTNKIVGNIVATSNNWSFKVNVENGSIENDYYKVPITNSSGQVNITLNTSSSNNGAEYTIELTGYNLPSDIAYYKDSSYTNVIENNVYNGSINKNVTSTIVIYYKSSNTINGYLYVRVKAKVKDGNTLYEYISKLANNGVDSSINFGRASSSTNGDGINIVSGTETSSFPIYYYRGNITNNNIIYAGFCWKIVRTTETGGVKLIYNGTPTNGKCNNIGKNSALKSNSAYNNNSGSPIYVGYMYGLTAYTTSQLSEYKNHLEDTGLVPDTNTQTETIGTTRVNIAGRHNQNAKSSTIKIAIDKWYQSNILNASYEEMLEDTVWCNDRTVSTGTYSPDNFSRNSVFHYMSLDRLSTNPYKPTLECSRNIDKFTVNADNGNGDLEYPIRLITADEMAFAGVGYSANADSYLVTGQLWWTLTPYSQESMTFVFLEVSVGRLGSNGVVLSNGVRPAVSLNNSVLFKSGDGTTDSPYIVE